MLPRAARHISNWPNGLLEGTWDQMFFSVVTVAVAVFSNLAYLGLALDRSRAAESRLLEARLLDQARREAAEEHAAELRDMLDQRDRMAVERDQLLQVMAHEIRQPLHNASGALQSANLALQSQRADGIALAAERVRRADGVLRDVHSVLDNTLAATSLMAGREPLLLQEVDLDLLAALALGDLPSAERERVQLQRDPNLLSAEVEPGLIRLALRNLLRNAFAHGGPATQVTLSIAEHDDPPSLWLSVQDDGCGLAPDRLQDLQADTAAVAAGATQSQSQSHGLGLGIVRRVMALHGGRLLLAAQQPRGLSATLSFPLPQADAGPLR